MRKPFWWKAKDCLHEFGSKEWRADPDGTKTFGVGGEQQLGIGIGEAVGEGNGFHIVVKKQPVISRRGFGRKSR